MSDPAIAAARRAWVSNAARQPYPTERELMTYAAREMAKPIRELHKRWSMPAKPWVPPEMQRLLDELAPLIFTTEELQ